jgi:hypothetical protein
MREPTTSGSSVSPGPWDSPALPPGQTSGPNAGGGTRRRDAAS